MKRLNYNSSYTISGLGLSDLFFNHEKPYYDAVMRSAYVAQETASAESVREALLEDASAFREMSGLCEDVTNEELADDFLARL